MSAPESVEDKLPSGFHTKQAAKAAKVRRVVQQHCSRQLLLESAGSIEFQPGDSAITQHQLLAEAPIAARPSRFELQLQYGPYSAAYDSSGRQLAICGSAGHVAAFEWRSKKLLFETQVNDACKDLVWIGTGAQQQLAVAQSNWTFIYDAQGIELHCMKRLYRTNRLLWLPHHWLLAACTDTGHLHWQDASTGSTAGSYCGHQGPLRVAALHSATGCVLTGHPSGCVSAWTPLERKPVLKLLCCQSAGVRALATDSGHNVFTLGGDSQLSVWDLRHLERPLSTARLQQQALGGQLAVSQRGLLAASMRDQVVVLPDIVQQQQQSEHRGLRPLLRLPTGGGCATSLAFCPWEDALCIGHRRGVACAVVPGSGEPNPDSLGGAHPLASSRRQRREAQVRSLLDKLPPETIRLPTASASAAGIVEIDEEAIEEALERKRAAIMALPSEQVRGFKPKRRQKASGKSAKVEQRKIGVKWQRRRLELKELLKSKRKLLAEAKADAAAAEAAAAEGGEAQAARRKRRGQKVANGKRVVTTGTYLDKLISKDE